VVKITETEMLRMCRNKYLSDLFSKDL